MTTLAVSHPKKLERRTDMYLSTLRNYIEAMGGKLEIIARFPNQAVRIMHFETLDPETRTKGVENIAVTQKRRSVHAKLTTDN